MNDDERIPVDKPFWWYITEMKSDYFLPLNDSELEERRHEMRRRVMKRNTLLYRWFLACAPLCIILPPFINSALAGWFGGGILLLGWFGLGCHTLWLENEKKYNARMDRMLEDSAAIIEDD